MNILIFGFLCLVSSGIVHGQQWQMRTASLMSPWSEKIDPENVLPEYPRPMMVREKWINLNGIWEFQEYDIGDKAPFGRTLTKEILVPFPWESAISGIQDTTKHHRAWYRRSFTLPEEWNGQHVLLHFGAVDWESTVYVNGQAAGIHKGGYDAFHFDITPFLTNGETNELLVFVHDPGNLEGIAVGKQNNSRFSDPQRYTYSPSSGIWQTIWLEPVPAKHIQDVHIVPDVDNSLVKISVNMSTHQTANLSIEAMVMEGGKVLQKGAGSLGDDLNLSIPHPKLWSPDSPFLYDLKIRIKNGDEVVDEVKSYFGMRMIGIKSFMNVQRIVLNDEFLFQMGPLDQGYWPDGIYTAPTDEALKWEVENIKKLGFNMIRKHIKIEPQRWYYWCDKLGVLVWQDMPNTFLKRTREEEVQFETELQRMVKGLWNHPSIINWIVFNEHWGAYDVRRITESVMALDPSRLVTGNSGIDAGKPNVDYEVGHIKDNHSYRPPSVPFGNDRRAVVNGEYGAIGYKVEGHIWDEDGPWVHYNYEGKDAATAEYVRFIEMIHKYQEEGLSGAVYTQWTDVENEMNGIYTYDRKVPKLDLQQVTDSNKSTYAKDRMKEKYLPEKTK